MHSRLARYVENSSRQRPATNGGIPHVGSNITLRGPRRICPTQYRHPTNPVNRMPILHAVMTHSALQRHEYYCGRGNGHGSQPHVGQHAETPPPQFTSRVPGSQSLRVVPHAGDSTPTMFQGNQVKRIMTLGYRDQPLASRRGGGKVVRVSGGMFCWSSQDRTGYGSSATMFLATKRRIASLMALIMHLRYGPQTPLDRVVCTRFLRLSPLV